MNNVFHIGFYKTGSTLLQNGLFPQLKERFYVGGYDLMYNHDFNRMLFGDAVESSILAVKNELFSKNRPFLLSSEWLSGDQKFYGINRTEIADRLYKIDPNAEVVLLIRGQAEMLYSYYNQLVKVGRTTLKLEEFYPMQPNSDNSISLTDINGRITNGKYDQLPRKEYAIHPMENRMNADFFNYFDLIEIYNSRFSKVHIFLFEDLKMNFGGTIERLLNVLGESSEIDVSTFQEKRENSSLKPKELEIRRMMTKVSALTSNATLLSVAKGLIKLSVRDQSSGHEKYLKQYAKAHYSSSNKKLAEKYANIGLDRYSSHYLLDQ